jgi:hypothetical protein
MRRAILCGVLLRAGCGRPAAENQSGGSAHREGLSNPTAERGKRRDNLGDERKASGQIAGDADESRSPAADMTLDPVYTPREEDTATLIADGTLGFSRASLFDDYYKATEPEDPDRLRAMIARKELVELEGNVPVLVLRNLDPADAREPDRHYGLEVRILAGTRKGETWFVDESAVGRLVPKVAHPPMAPGSYATVVSSETIGYVGWEALDPAARPPGDAAKPESFRIGRGIRVVVLESRGEAVRVRIDSGSESVGRVGVVKASDLRPIVPQSSPAHSRPAAGR